VNDSGWLTATMTTTSISEEPTEAQKTTNEDNGGGRQ